MRRKLAILLTMVLLISLLAVPTYAASVGDFTVDLFYYNADKSVKKAFTGSSVTLAAALDPFQGQIRITLPDEIEPGDYFDLDLSFTATGGTYTVDQIELCSTGDTYFDLFTYSYVEMDSNHLLIKGLCADERATGIANVGVVIINYSVVAPEYEETTTVINGTPTKQYCFRMTVSDATVTGIGELGFFARMLEGILNLPNLLVEGVKKLFMPTQAEAVAFRDKLDALLAERLGPAYEASDIIEDFAYSLGNSAATLEENSKPATITMPTLTVDLAGADFTFGGWEVQIIPNGFEDIVFVLKNVVNMVCTLLFVNALRDRLEGVLH